MDLLVASAFLVRYPRAAKPPETCTPSILGISWGDARARLLAERNIGKNQIFSSTRQDDVVTVGRIIMGRSQHRQLP